MNSLALLVAAASLGVDYGWQPTDDGQLEYIIQMEPSLLTLLKQGQEIVSEIHPDAKGVRRFRILVGKGDLPRQGLPEATPPREPEPAEEPDEQAELTLKRPDIRVAGQARNDFQVAAEPGPDEEEPADPFPARSKRRRGVEFGVPDEPAEEAARPRQLDTLEPDPTGAPLKHRTVGHTEKWENQATGAEKAAQDDKPGKAKPEPAKPWFPFTVSLLLLFGSLGGNAYLGWLAKDFYNRYKALAEELREPRAVDE